MKETFHKMVRGILPDSAKTRLVSWVYKMQPDRFREFAYNRNLAPDMRLGLSKLAARGLQPRHVADIGAFHGEWGIMARNIWPEAKITMLEANPGKQQTLSDVASQIDADLKMAVLGPEDGQEVVFHIMEAGSSVFPENSPLPREEKTLETARLDTLLAEDKPDFVKIDVQGFEIEVLKGATDILTGAQAVLVEVSLIAINEGAPLLSDVVAFMKSKGFEVCDVVEVHRRPLDRATNQLDFLFVPWNSGLLSDTRHFA